MATDYDHTKICASGPILSSAGQTGKRCIFNVKGVPKDFVGDLKFACDGGSTRPDILFTGEDSNDDSVELYFVPLVPGDYKLTVRCRGKQINGSPFRVRITGETIQAASLLSKVKVHGRAVELGKAYSINEFVVDCRGLHPVIGGLAIHMKGPERSSATLNLRDNHNGTHTVAYKPTSPGIYSLNIKIADEHIPGSPFSVRVTEFLSS